MYTVYMNSELCVKLKECLDYSKSYHQAIPEKDLEFAKKMVRLAAYIEGFEPSEKQAKWIESIMERLERVKVEAAAYPDGIKELKKLCGIETE